MGKIFFIDFCILLSPLLVILSIAGLYVNLMYDECLNLMNVNIGTASQRERKEKIEHKHNTENQKKKKKSNSSL